MDAPATILAALDAANRRDLDAVAALVDDDFVGVVPPEMSAEPDSYVGPDGIRRYFELWYDIVDGLVFEVERFEAEGDWTIGIGSVSGAGRATGLELKLDFALATLLRDGKIVRIEAFPSGDDAHRELAER